MKNILFAFILILLGTGAMSQTPGETAKTFIRQGDYANAILVLNQALQSDRENLELKKDLALAYYLTRDYPKAIAILKPIVENSTADVQSIQILGMVYKATEDIREAEKTYKVGVRRFPEAGVLYSEYGELLWAMAEFPEASKQWLKGIEVDENYPGNYYHAARYYFMTADKVWGLLYGEIFVNMESYSQRTP